MLWLRGSIGPVKYAFTDSEVDLASEAGRQNIAASLGLADVAYMKQVHGTRTLEAEAGTLPEADGLITNGVAAAVRVADCTPLVLAAPNEGLAAVVHAGRVGMSHGVVKQAVEAMVEHGATELHAVLGPRACGRCYEVPAQMADEVERSAPGSRARTSWGTDSIDVGAGVRGQLAALGVTHVDDPGQQACTIEDERFFSYRRQGEAAGRFGAIVWVEHE